MIRPGRHLATLHDADTDMNMPPCTLRRPTANDEGMCVAIHCDPRTNLYRPGGAPTAEQASAFFQAWLDHWSEHGFGYWSVVARATNRVVGFGGIMFKQVGPYHGLNLYFRLAPSAWGQGLSGHVGRAAFRQAFCTLGYDRVLASTRRNNEPSRRALERLGMVEMETVVGSTGEPPSIIYAMSRSAFESTD